ncbi:dual specificity protein phosphatase 8 [Brachyistius frenatus]|uniref:dual specificity protein phosphatase 8 n=1 Tax=Brachyistius frenatus TaxID=100188 RepID=UPI0037E9A5D6
MVWSRETQEERPPLSVILPRLYLGAESDVTQERLASMGISYVLSVSRCSPQPSFLPRSRYLRIPIDDSLWDDLLPWIPQALHFIDAAMLSGASVLVHCAAGISRSPALAVAYIMYSLEMDLDHAYRFVKERRPSISPNFNFLGQLQHFQGALSQKASGGDSFMPSVTDTESRSHGSYQADGVTAASTHRRDRTQRLSAEGDNQRHEPHTPDVALQQHHREPIKPAPKPAELQLPSGSVSLLEKRKSLTLSLTPLGINPPSARGGGGAMSKTVPSGEMGDTPEAKTPSGPGSYGQAGDACTEPSRSPSRCGRTEVKESGLLSPFSFSLNKLLGWGERVLLGGVFMHPVRMGQPALPYRC